MPRPSPTSDQHQRKPAHDTGQWAEPAVAQVESAVLAFGLLADPTRVRILWRLTAGGADVATLAAAARCSPTAASQHLSKLRLAGLVAARRQGRRMVYELRHPQIPFLVEHALFGGDLPAVLPITAEG